MKEKEQKPPATNPKVPTPEGSLSEAPKEKERHPFRTGFIVGALVTIAITLLIIQNTDSVRFEWLFFDFEWPLWVVLLVAFVGGMVAWQLLLHRFERRRKARAAAKGTDAGGRRGRKKAR